MNKFHLRMLKLTFRRGSKVTEPGPQQQDQIGLECGFVGSRCAGRPDRSDILLLAARPASLPCLRLADRNSGPLTKRAKLVRPFSLENSPSGNAARRFRGT